MSIKQPNGALTKDLKGFWPRSFLERAFPAYASLGVSGLPGGRGELRCTREDRNGGRLSLLFLLP